MLLCLKQCLPNCSQDKRQKFLTWPGELYIIWILLNIPNSSSWCPPLHSVLQWAGLLPVLQIGHGSSHYRAFAHVPGVIHLHLPYWLLCLLQIVGCHHFLRRPILILVSRSNASIIDCHNTFYLCVIVPIAETIICLWITWFMLLPSETILFTAILLVVGEISHIDP